MIATEDYDSSAGLSLINPDALVECGWVVGW